MRLHCEIYVGRYSFCGIGGVVKTFVVILFLFLTVKILGAEYNDEALFMKMIVYIQLVTSTE